MKALKEKRLSLRSLIRGGLVILSLFALVFAIGCNTSSDPEPEPGPGTDSTGGTVAPTQPYVLAILVEEKPTDLSFQGLPPNMTGATVRVVWNNQQVQYIKGEDLEKNGFYATANCDIAGTADTGALGYDATVTNPGLFYIAHKGSTVFSNGFNLPGVLPLKSIGFNNSGSLDWYADQRPDFAKLGLRGQYEWVIDAPTGKVNWAKTIAGTQPNSDPAIELKGADAKDIPISQGYPAMDITRVVSGKVIKVGIGKSEKSPKGGDAASDNWIDYGPLFNPPTYSDGTNPTGWLYDKVASSKIANFYKLSSITVNGEVGSYGFDDDANLAGWDIWTSGGGLTLNQTKGNEAKLAKVKAANLSFDVEYDDGKAAHRISWNDFYSNLLYIYGGDAPTVDDLIFGGDKIKAPKTDSSNTPRLLDFDDEDYTWTIKVRYVPIEYATSNTTYDGTVDIRLPVYEFQELSPAVQKGANLQVLFDPTAGPNFKFDMDIINDVANRKLLDAINDKWTLTGNYERNGDLKTKNLKFTADMFNLAAGGQVSLGTGALSAQVSAASGLYSGRQVIQKNYVLPFVYRGDRKTADDEAVIVDLYYDFTP